MYYVVDSANRIADVGDGWDEAAAGVDGDGGSLSAHVLGRPLESCMVGDATKMFVRAALDAARILKQTRVLPYRCDSAQWHRHFEMVISPMADGHVKVEHRLVKATPVVPRRRAHRARHAHLSLEAPVVAGWRCSQCLRVRLHGSENWLELDLEPQAWLAQDVCPVCAGRLLESALEVSHSASAGRLPL